jgi:hypothetical protein
MTKQILKVMKQNKKMVTQQLKIEEDGDDTND